MGAVSESLGEDSPGDLSSLLCGVPKGKDRLPFRVQWNAKEGVLYVQDRVVSGTWGYLG
jgi:hypothetical protein